MPAATRSRSCSRWPRTSIKSATPPNEPAKDQSSSATTGRKFIKALLATKQPIDETGKSLAELGKLHRDISADQVKQAHDIKEAWDDFGKAVRALKDQLGTLFLGGELKRAEWLTNLIDGTTELLRMFRDTR